MEVNKNIIESVTDTKMEFRKVDDPTKKDGTFDKMSKFINGKNSTFIKSMLFLMITAPLMLLCMYNLGKPKVEVFSIEQKIPYHGTEIGVSMSKEDLTLDYEIDHATIKLNDKYIELDNDTIDNILNTDLNIINNKFIDNGMEYTIGSELKVESLDNYNDMLYIVYKNKELNGMREVLVSKDLKDGLVIDGMQSVNNGSDIYESNTTLSVNAFTRAYDNSVIYYSDQLLGGEIGTKTLVSRVQNIKDNMKYSILEHGQSEEVTIKFDELRDIKLSKLSALKSGPGVYFSEDDGVLRFYNYVEDKPYVFVSHVNNQLFFCNADELLETNYLNLYVTRGFDDPESAGYRTFAITTKNNMYAFRIASDADENLVSELFNEFGYVRENLSIKPVQEMVSTDVVENTIVVESTNTLEGSENAGDQDGETGETGETGE